MHLEKYYDKHADIYEQSSSITIVLIAIKKSIGSNQMSMIRRLVKYSTVNSYNVEHYHM